jgi:predicted outer membrane lipoprotein
MKSEPQGRNTKSKKPVITGNTVRVYLHVLRHGPCELREVQHGLNFSSPSLASYHLRKLMESGYVSQDEFGKYAALSEGTFELLGGYSKLGASVVPQSFFFSLLLTILVAFFGIEALLNPAITPYLLAAALGTVGALWYETVRLWRKLATWN